ncbi:unnamed protein product [Arabidopsis halleri]
MMRLWRCDWNQNIAKGSVRFPTESEPTWVSVKA